MKNIDAMLDEFMDQYPQAADEIEALRSKVSGPSFGDEAEAPAEEGEEFNIEIEPGSAKPIPPELMDDEAPAEDEDEDEESMF